MLIASRLDTNDAARKGQTCRVSAGEKQGGVGWGVGGLRVWLGWGGVRGEKTCNVHYVPSPTPDVAVVREVTSTTV